MVEKTQKIYEDSKKSLQTLLREKAYSEIKENLEDQGINIDDMNDEDVESLVAAKVQDKETALKGFGTGAAIAIAFSLLTGI